MFNVYNIVCKDTSYLSVRLTMRFVGNYLWKSLGSCLSLFVCHSVCAALPKQYHQTFMQICCLFCLFYVKMVYHNTGSPMTKYYP